MTNFIGSLLIHFIILSAIIAMAFFHIKICREAETNGKKYLRIIASIIGISVGALAAFTGNTIPSIFASIFTAIAPFSLLTFFYYISSFVMGYVVTWFVIKMMKKYYTSNENWIKGILLFSSLLWFMILDLYMRAFGNGHGLITNPNSTVANINNNLVINFTFVVGVFIAFLFAKGSDEIFNKKENEDFWFK